jgi:hypothetical protein
MLLRRGLQYRLDAGHELHDAGHLETIVDLLAALVVNHHPGLFEHVEVLGDCGKIGIEVFHQLTHALFALAQSFGDPQSGGMAKGFEHRSLSLEQGLFMVFHSHLLLSYLVKQPNVSVKKKILAERIATAYFLSSE